MEAEAQRNVVREFEGSTLGDERRRNRLMRLAEEMAADPSASFPTATKTNAALEAAYRFLENEAARWTGS